MRPLKLRISSKDIRDITPNHMSFKGPYCKHWDIGRPRWPSRTMSETSIAALRLSNKVDFTYWKCGEIEKHKGAPIGSGGLEIRPLKGEVPASEQTTCRCYGNPNVRMIMDNKVRRAKTSERERNDQVTWSTIVNEARHPSHLLFQRRIHRSLRARSNCSSTLSCPNGTQTGY